MAQYVIDQVGWYGAAVGAILAIKLLMSVPFGGRRKPITWEKSTKRLTAAAVITVFNEDVRALHACLESILKQTRLPDVLTIIDDGSKSPDAADLAEACAPYFQSRGVRFEVIRFSENQGKREGLAAGFRSAWDADVYVCVDSDTVLREDAIERALAPFSSREVMCVTGLVLAINRSVNLLTRLIDMRYVNAFLGERVAYSRLGSVLCACGSLALYRGWVVRKHLDDFVTQRFLGAPATAGDDRRLTYYCLMEGKALIEPHAVAWTAVPERLSHYLRQQTRWTKSFIRESLLMCRTSPRRPCWWLNLLELATWVAFTSALLVALGMLATHPHWWTAAASYLAYVCGISWFRSLHYLRGAPGVPRGDRLLTFFAAPTYALMNLTLLIPLRLYAIATIRNAKWGTRESVEVTLQPAGTRKDVEVALTS